jgi:4-amino-4-deoxy-L-arabinose transferase-like glycosyltransferase
VVLSGQRIDRSWTALVIFLLGVCLFAGLGSIGLVGPDEPRYASIARAMARTGDWLTPRLWGQAWFEKPILYYWSAGAAFRLFGASEWAARLPSALAALAAALLLGWAAKRVFGTGTAILVLAIFPTTLGLLAFAHAATMDMLLAACLEAAMVAALFAIDWRAGANPPRRNSSSLALAATGACIGLGTLAKGPVAIILAGGSVVLWAILSKRWRDALRFLRWEPMAAFAVVALPWYVACSLANPGFAYSFLWHQNVQRFLTPVFEHVQPWWFFFPILILGLLPWTAALILAARDGWKIFRAGRADQSPALFAACWAAFPLIFFSFSKSKLPGYVLPALPPLVLLIACAIDRVIGQRENREKPPGRLGNWVLGLVGLTWIVLSLTAGHWLRRLPKTWDIAHQSAILSVLGITAAVGVAVIVLASMGRTRVAVAASALSMGILTCTIAWIFLPQIDPYLSARDAARAARQVAGQSAVETYGLNRDWTYGLDYYLGQELPEWSPTENQPVWVYTTRNSLAALAGQKRQVGPVMKLPGGIVFARISGRSR